MKNDNNIKTFTAADIEKYHKGLLSFKERHELEKAALEDPFLADAMEGYLTTGVNIDTDIHELKKRLAEKSETAAVIPINSTGKKFPWFRAAAAVLIIAGTAVLANQFLFNKKSVDIAQVNPIETTPSKEEVIKATDSAITPSTNNSGQSEVNTNEPVKDKAVIPGIKDPKSTTADEKNKVIGGNNGAAEKTPTDITVIESKPSNPIPVKPVTEKTETVVVTGYAKEKDVEKVANARKAVPSVSAADENKEKTKELAEQQAEWNKVNRAVTSNRKAEEQNYRNQTNNIFRGRVTDASNVGVPFANITNVEDNAGTYSDAKGNFILTSPDSILTVQVRSIGFENNQIQLRNYLSNNQVVLQDDRNSLSEVVVSNQKPNVAARSRDANKTMEESEPADGWDNYDTYVANNLNMPEEVKYKQTTTSSVQVSFEVDKNGEPVNIRVEKKSFCATCDKEAIRLIKEGPKWKRNANKKGRTTVTINF
ncbi:MAG: carboxypeptidase-like regulatory domain-containing protein [Chitinophagaceae bacterium]